MNKPHWYEEEEEQQEEEQEQEQQQEEQEEQEKEKEEEEEEKEGEEEEEEEEAILYFKSLKAADHEISSCDDFNIGLQGLQDQLKHTANLLLGNLGHSTDLWKQNKTFTLPLV